jgi:16S rRNA (adenine1518-N6/adenine1519-N6)-dimethyltransferase
MTERFEHKRSLGQNFLNSNYVPKKMCAAGDVRIDDVVLEIGPGVGALTKELLVRGARVVAVEADKRAIHILEETFAPQIASGQLSLHHQDARKLSLSSLGLHDRQFKVVANVPYYLSSFLLRQLLDSDTQPKTLVFLLQKELVTRIARDKKMSLLSLSVRVFGDPTYIGTVGRGHFTPQPKVDSAILLVSNINRDRLGAIPGDEFFSLLQLGFGQKRKQLQHNLSAKYQREIIRRSLRQIDLTEAVRAEDVPLEKWLLLCTLLSTSE